jgi:sugar-specific transcriptional regulator TrmB
MYKNILEKTGLKPGEAAIYDVLLLDGDSPASTLTSKTNYKRGMVYKFLDDLKKKGLVSSYNKKGATEKSKKTYFRAEPPQKLMDQIENSLQEARSQKEALEAVLPNLETKYRLQQTKPSVTYYEGLAGTKKIFQDIYSPKDEPVYGCIDLEKADAAIPDHITKELIPLRIKNNVLAISFVADSPKGRDVHDKDEESLRKSVLLDKEEYPIPAEIDVYENKVAMLSFDREQFVGILIENKDIATTLKTIFRLAFKNAGQIKDKVKN